MIETHFTCRASLVAQMIVTGIASPYTNTYLYRQVGTPLELLRQQGAPPAATGTCSTGGRRGRPSAR